MSKNIAKTLLKKAIRNSKTIVAYNIKMLDVKPRKIKLAFIRNSVRYLFQVMQDMQFDELSYKGMTTSYKLHKMGLRVKEDK